ncbi:MAG: ABC transporter substrate-binding protein [Alphaproteobacteria bacterium]|nr:ABC transporter substrate-binding protein [Alphaproteobacteria bacterium]
MFRSLSIALAGLALAAGAAQAQPVKLGVLNDQSGLYADLTGMGSVHATRMAVEDFGGKVLGRPIEVIFADHQNKPDVGASIARQWIENDHVNALFDIPNSAVGLAVQEVARDRDAVAINTGAATSDLSGKACSPHGIHWTFDTYALAAGTGKALVKQGLDTWFFITADYAFGHALERDTAQFVEAGGGKVLGAVRHPLSTPDFSSFLLQAQGSKAKAIGLANAGGDTINSVKQAAEFGIVKGGQRIAGLLVQFPDVHALGLATAQGIAMTASFDWSLTDQTRSWTQRFLKLNAGKPPSMIHAGTYGGTLHYLKAVQAAGTTEATKVVAKMKELPVDDFYTKATIREDGRVMRPYYLMEVKKPEESKGPFDYTKLLATIPPEDAGRPLAEGGCPMLKKS